MLGDSDFVGVLGLARHGVERFVQFGYGRVVTVNGGGRAELVGGSGRVFVKPVLAGGGIVKNHGVYGGNPLCPGCGLRVEYCV